MADTPRLPPSQQELDKFDAEAERARAEGVKFAAEATAALAAAAKADLEARKARLDVEKAERERREADASDVHHHLYRFTGSVDAASVDKAITKLTEWHRLSTDPADTPIEIVFFSPGGAIIPGFALFDHLRWLSAQGHRITTGCTGMAASMGGILMQAGDHRWMSGEAWYLIHRAAFGAAGKTFDIEDEVEGVKRIEARIINIFTARSHLTATKIKRNWDRKDWWIDSDQAMEHGLVDEIRGALTTPDAA